MPGGDRTGPLGMGPMTGRAAGYCAGYGVPGYMNPMPGRGFGRGFGFGRGMGWGRGAGFGRGMGWGRRAFWGGAPVGYVAPAAYAPTAYAPPYAPAYGPPTPAEERTVLEGQMGALQAQLDQIKQRLDELGAQEAQEK